MRVLVVEDDRDLAELMVEALEMDGVDARAAHDPREALELVKNYQPDAIILDWMLPAISGEGFLYMLSDYAQTEPRIVVYTASGTDPTDKAWGHEIAAVLRKPFELTELPRALGLVPVPADAP